MSKDVYDGSWNWDRIYRECHGAFGVSQEVHQVLGRGRERVVFAGFAAVAASLAETRPLKFVDRSEDVISAARSSYAKLTTFATDDVLNHLLLDDAPHVVISGRLSAFWDDQEYFERLQKAILTYPRSCVVVDFFDAKATQTSQVFSFGSPPASGVWRTQNVRRRFTTWGPKIHRVKQEVSYVLDQNIFEYQVERSYFRAADVLSWAEKCFLSYTAEIARPLILEDPSFTLVLRPRRRR